MSCRKDVEKAIFDKIFASHINGMPTFRRAGLDTIEITQQARNKSDKNPRAQAIEILKSKVKGIATAYNGHVIGRVNDTDVYSPVSVTLKINPQYIDYVYNTQLKAAQKTDDLLAPSVGNNANNINSGTGSNTSANLGIAYASPTVGYYTKFIQSKEDSLLDSQRRLKAVKKEQKAKDVTAAKLKELNKEETKLDREINGSTEFKIKGLKEEIRELKSKANVNAVGYYVEKDLERIKLLSESNNILELNEAKRLVNFYELAATWSFPGGEANWNNPFFLKADVYQEDINGVLTNSYKLQDADRLQYEEWARKASYYTEIIDKKLGEVATRIVNTDTSVENTYGKNKFTISDLTMAGKGMKDTSWIDMWVMDITNGIFSKNGILPSAIHSILTHDMTEQEAIARGFAERTDKLNPTVLEKLRSLGQTLKNAGIDGVTQGVYTIFLERNANNQLTGNSTYKYNSVYENAKALIRNAFKEAFNNAKDIADPAISQAEFRKAFAQKRAWTRNNTIMMRFNAIPEIMIDAEFSNYPFAKQADADAHKAYLLSVIGQREYDKQVAEQKRLLRNYNVRKLSMLDELMEKENITDPNSLSQKSIDAMNRWTKSNSPFYGLNDYYETSFDDGNSSGNYQAYNILIPRKNKVSISKDATGKVYNFTDTAAKMDINYYNNTFEKYIEADDDLYAFHTLLAEAMDYVKQSADPELSAKMAVNWLGSMDKTSAEIITDKADARWTLTQVIPAFKQWWDKFRLSFGVVKQRDLSNERLDINGKPNYKVNDAFLRDNQAAIDNKIFIEKTKFIRAFNAGGNKIIDLKRFSMLNITNFNIPSLIMLADLLDIQVSLADIKAGNLTAFTNRLGGDRVQIMKILQDYATHEIVKENSFDLSKMIKHLTSAAAMYSARTEALPKLELLKNYYDNIERVRSNNLLTPIYNLRHNRHESEGTRHQGVQQMQNWWDRVLLDNYGPKHTGVMGSTSVKNKNEKQIAELTVKIDNINTPKAEKTKLEAQRERLILDDKVRTFGKTIYSKEDAKRLAEIEVLLGQSNDTRTADELKTAAQLIAEQLANPNNPPANPSQLRRDQAALLERARLVSLKDSLGKTRTATAFFDNFLGYLRTLRLGWNLSSMLTNMIEGYSSNMLIAATGEYMNPDEIYFGYHVAKLSMLKNVGLETPLARKSRMLMDMFDVLMDSKNELQKSSVKTFSNKFEKFNPHAGNQRVEFINQSALMIGIARSTMINDGKGNSIKLFDAYATDGSRQLKSQWRTPENIENWEDLTGPQYQVYRAKLRKAIVLAHGNYDELRGMMIKSNSVGKALAMFKTWLPQQIYWRFAVEQDDIQGGTEGFKGKYFSYGIGSGMLHGAMVGLAITGPIGALVGGVGGAFLGGSFGKRLNKGSLKDMFLGGNDSIGLLRETLISAKVLSKKMIGMPINSIWGGKVIGTSGKEFDAWVGKAGFTQTDANALKANMSDIGLQLFWLGMMLIAKGAFWDDDDDADSAKRKAHNIIVNKMMQLGSQAAMYTNPVEAHKTVIGSVAILSYLSEVEKEIVALEKWANGDDEIQGGINKGESRLMNQTIKTFAPGLFKDTNPVSSIIKGKVPTLGFESQMERQFNESGWDKYFKLEVSKTRQEIKAKMDAKGATGAEIKEELDNMAPTKDFLKKRGTTRKEWLKMSEDQKEELDQQLKLEQKEARDIKEEARQAREAANQ